MTPLSEDNSKWLNAFSDPLAGLYTFTSCMALADLTGDGDSKLIMGDLGTGQYNMKLKVYKGTVLMSENTLIELPTAICIFFMDNVEPRIPAIAVTSGSCIYVYKNLKPYYKFTLPSQEISNAEREIWDHVRLGKLDSRSLTEFIESLRNQMTAAALSPRSLWYLITPESERETFISKYKDEALKRQTVITCITTLKRNSQDADAINTLVFGTENCSVSIIDSEAFTMLADASLPATAVFIHASGLYDVEYRLIVSCRNGSIYSLKRGVKYVNKAIIELNSHAVGITKLQKHIYVACMDNTLRCYSLKGKKLFSIRLPGNIMTIECLDYRPKNYSGIVVALDNKEVHIYKDMFLVDLIKVDDVVTALKFGNFGREEGALVMAMRGGGLNVKLLKRTAVFDDKATAPGPPASQSTKLNVPKKTKVFVDQTMREREQALKMHQIFQKDLFMLRLETARAYARTLQSSMAPIRSGSGGDSMIKLSAEVQGFGPIFLLNINIQSTSAEPLIDLYINFMYSSKLYTVEKPYIPLGMLVPGVQYTYKTKVTCLSDKGQSDTLKVFVVREGNSLPIITAIISMPVSELALV